MPFGKPKSDSGYKSEASEPSEPVARTRRESSSPRGGFKARVVEIMGSSLNDQSKIAALAKLCQEES